jgi:signal peptidase I
LTDEASGVPAEETAAPTAEPKRSKGAAAWHEIKGILWVLLAVLAFHSFVAKPFYIPSESMMPALLKGDRLVVSKYPYGWSYVSPTIPNPLAILRSVFLRTGEGWGITLPFREGRFLGKVPERGDIVIVTPPGSNEDYIKRVIGLPGDTIAVRAGRVILNGRPLKWERRPHALIPVDANVPCGIEFSGHYVQSGDRAFCRLPIVRETLPNGVSYDTIELGQSPGDEFSGVKVPAGHVFLMGDNRDRSADSRFSLGQPENGLGGPVPWENIGGRAEFITFSLDGTTQVFNPLSWFRALRSGRAGESLRGSTE